jgi:hypothetical protein
LDIFDENENGTSCSDHTRVVVKTTYGITYKNNLSEKNLNKKHKDFSKCTC